MAIFQVTNTISTLEKLPLKNGYIYYIANLDDLSDIMSHGISAISTDPKRSHAEPIYGKAISEYVSLYFNPRNATLYSAQKSYGSKVIILQIHKTALLTDGVIFTNASATAARYECANELSDLLNTQFISWSEVMSKGWNHANKSIKQSKRDKMMAEALVPTHLPIDMIAGIICQDSSIAKSIASDYNITAVADMEYFFPIKLYAPQSKDELENLICDEDIYLGDIDTSAITDMSELFYESWREDFSGIENWDVSSVTNMSGMFFGCDNFNQPLDNWNVSSVVNMSGMFSCCTNFNQPLDNWDVSSVIDMVAMFRDCKNFNQPLDSWDVSSVIYMNSMFSGCRNFNQPLNNWDVSSVTDMTGMFNGTESFNQPLNNWDISSITDMSEMFKYCTNFNQPLNSWDVSSVTDMSNMFNHAGNFNQPLNSWDVSSVTDMSNMFNHAGNFNQPLNSWKDKLSQELINQLPLICFVERKIVNNKTRYYPKTKDELESLVRVESLNLGDIDTSAITDMSKLFYESWRKDFSGIESWDVSNVTDMRYMFRNCKNFNQSLNNWDVSSVVNMSDMFAGCENFNQPLNNWNVSSVTDMSGMFYDCKNFNQPLNNWDVSSVVNMYMMFSRCKNFNQPLDSWKDKLSQKLIDKLPLIYFVERKIVNNKTRYYPKTRNELRSLVRTESLNLGDIDTSAITDMSELFYESWREDFSGIENWDVSSVTNMSGMFFGCDNFNQPLDNWNVSSVVNMSEMFYNCYNFNQPLDNWDVSSVTDMSEMFDGCINFNQPLDSWKDKLSQELIDKLPLRCFVERKIVNNKTQYYPKTKDELESLVIARSLNLGDIDTSAITDMSKLFYESWRKDFSGIESWDVSSVTDMSKMFFGCDNFNQPLDNWDVRSVVNMSDMFAGCENFNQPLNNWDVSSVTNMSGMFFGCDNFNQPLDNWNVSSVVNMSGMFSCCTNFNQPLDNWDVSSVIDMVAMFRDCKNFNQPLDSWDVSSVIYMNSMFSGCRNFNQPLNNWDVSSVTDMSKMFFGCDNFNQPLDNWDVSSVTDMSKMFFGCDNFNQPLDNWDVRSVVNMSEMFYNCYNFNQPLDNWDVSSVTDMSEMFDGCINFNQPLDSWKDKPSQKLINQLPLICFVERKIVNNKTRYYPKTKDELESLVIARSLNLGDIDTSAITDMSELFYESERKDFSGIENWNVSNVTDMRYMFSDCK
ncbi:DarT ssDNA thymidine ADP-ribosyltransferase family protein, partial [Campylobacter sp. P0109]|uniref:DarT ssDNA thymidine ADP-ribosyltransferase family protein n=1 Tax=Campylobacter sp. P0109 TaxID=1895606 RepID=UPI0015D847F5